jgi:hypothetical protein
MEKKMLLASASRSGSPHANLFPDSSQAWIPLAKGGRGF